MTQFKENNPEQLKLFLRRLTYLVDEFHHDIYLLDGVFEGVNKIEVTIKDEINKTLDNK